MESNSINAGNLRTKNNRQKVLKTQQSLDGFITTDCRAQPEGSVYALQDPRDKDRTRNLLKMIAMDCRPFSIVSSPGFLCFCYSMDPHYELKSETFCPKWSFLGFF